jgi:hypothetical protein
MIDPSTLLNQATLTGNINYTYDNGVNIIPYVLNAIIAIFALIVFFLVIMWAFNKAYPQSRRYRELLSDMYVAGKIKRIASEDQIDLNEELKEFSKILRKTDIDTNSIDQVISNKLKERIADKEF